MTEHVMVTLSDIQKANRLLCQTVVPKEAYGWCHGHDTMFGNGVPCKACWAEDIMNGIVPRMHYSRSAWLKDWA
jgi:hypothetical protein